MGFSLTTWDLKDFSRKGYVDSGLSFNAEKSSEIEFLDLITYELFAYEDSVGYVVKVCSDDPIKVLIRIERYLKQYIPRTLPRKVVSNEPVMITFNGESIACIKTTLSKKKLFQKVSEIMTVFFDISDIVAG